VAKIDHSCCSRPLLEWLCRCRYSLDRKQQFSYNCMCPRLSILKELFIESFLRSLKAPFLNYLSKYFYVIKF